MVPKVSSKVDADSLIHLSLYTGYGFGSYTDLGLDSWSAATSYAPSGKLLNLSELQFVHL